MGFFPVDSKTLDYFEGTGRTKTEIEAFEAYFKAQGLFGVPKAGEIDYSQVVRLDLATVVPSLAGPKRPQDRIEIGHVAEKFQELFTAPIAQNGFNLSADKWRAASGCISMVKAKLPTPMPSPCPLVLHAMLWKWLPIHPMWKMHRAACAAMKRRCKHKSAEESTCTMAMC